MKKLTDAMVAIEGENMRPVTWCIVEEVKSGDWGIAGKPLTTGDVKALAAGGAKGLASSIFPPPTALGVRWARSWTG